MPHQKHPQNNERFQRELQRLRLEINSLPREKRPHLHELADLVERQHRDTREQAGRLSGSGS